MPPIDAEVVQCSVGVAIWHLRGLIDNSTANVRSQLLYFFSTPDTLILSMFQYRLEDREH